MLLYSIQTHTVTIAIVHRTFGMFFKPLQHVFHVTTVTTSLTPCEPKITDVQFTFIDSKIVFYKRKKLKTIYIFQINHLDEE